MSNSFFWCKIKTFISNFEQFNKLFDITILINTTTNNNEILKSTEFDFIFDIYNDNLIEEIIDMICSDTTDNKWLMIFEDNIVNNELENKILNLYMKYK